MVKDNRGGPSIDDWKVESDLNTLIECEKIKNDPKRLAAVRALAKQKMLDAAAIASADSTGKKA